MTNYESMILKSRAMEMQIMADQESAIMKLLLSEHKRISTVLDELSYPSQKLLISQLQTAQQQIENVMDNIYGKTGVWKGRRVAVGGELESLMVDAMQKASQAGIDGKMKASIALLNDVNPELIPYLPSLFSGIREDVIQKLMVRPLSDDRIFSQRFWKLKDLNENLISKTLSSGMLEGKSAREISKDLRQFLILQGEGRAVKGGPVIKQAWNTKKIISRTMTLARTEINNAFTESQIECAKREPWNDGIKWNLSASHKVYDICDVYASQDLYSMGNGIYPPDKVPVRHPNCWCFLTDILKSLDEVARLLKEDMKIPEREVISVKGAKPVEYKFKNSLLTSDDLKLHEEMFAKKLDTKSTKEPMGETKYQISKKLYTELKKNDDFVLSSLKIGSKRQNIFSFADNFYKLPEARTWQTQEDVLAFLNTDGAIGKINQAMSIMTAKERKEFVEFLKEAGEELSGDWISTWAATSADNHPVALALQFAANEEFNLKDSMLLHLKLGEDAGEVYTEHGMAMRAFLREQYNQTQEFLKDHEYVTLYRGMGYPTTKGFDFEFDDVVKDIKVAFQPISSFSTDIQTAKGFASSETFSIVVQSDVPRERILSTCQTGFGCKNEAEMTVLGGKENVKAVATGRRALSFLDKDELMSMFAK